MEAEFVVLINSVVKLMRNTRYKEFVLAWGVFVCFERSQGKAIGHVGVCQFVIWSEASIKVLLSLLCEQCFIFSNYLEISNGTIALIVFRYTHSILTAYCTLRTVSVLLLVKV